MNYYFDVAADGSALMQEIIDNEQMQHMPLKNHKEALIDVFKQDNKPVIEFFESYQMGTNSFFDSLAEQLAVKGRLSPKQCACVYREIDKKKNAVAIKDIPQVNMADHELVGQIIRLKRYFATQTAAKADLTNPHFHFEVLEVHRETAKALEMTLKLTAQRTSHCCLCGLTLTDLRSIEAGVGPVCADKNNLPWGEGERNALEVLAQRLETVETVRTWLPKSAIKEIVK